MTMTSTTTSAPTAAYFRLLQEGRLCFQRCTTCARAVFYPRVLCPACGGTDLTWEESSGRGQVHAATTVYPRGEAAYNVSLIDLAEGYRMMSNVVGIDPERVAPGLAVQVCIEQRDDDPLPVFAPRSDE